MHFSKLKEITGHSAGIYSVTHSGAMLYSASADRYVARWKIDEGIQDKFSIRFNEPVYSVAVSDLNRLIIAGLSNGDLHVFSLEEKKELRFFTQHRAAIFSIVTNESKGHFYTADADGNLAVWRLKDQELLLFLPINCGKIRRLAIDQHGLQLALCCADGGLRILDTEFFNETHRINAHRDGVTTALFLIDGQTIVTGGKDAYLRKWDLKGGELLNEVPAHNYVIYDLLSLNEGRTIVSASRDKTVKIWDTELNFLQRLDQKSGGHRHSVNSLCKLDELSFVSASDDKRMIIWKSDD